ncbi:hypothetical protein [Microbacterium aurantiacum]|uniref:Uncharacterized protein n=1 Tax=Microbacterium aurantiacum TaxID=162393 RepID=A0AAJ2HMU5_9MICO|nr:hypothetical protein [Microbacterium aurantiacum]MDS0246966.1 hypothetical protein [Microbacterium aurantiacum]
MHITVITFVALLILGFVATFRLAMPLVAPPPPTPDYTVQAVIAAASMIAISWPPSVRVFTPHAASQIAVGSQPVRQSLCRRYLIGSILAFTLS